MLNKFFCHLSALQTKEVNWLKVLSLDCYAQVSVLSTDCHILNAQSSEGRKWWLKHQCATFKKNKDSIIKTHLPILKIITPIKLIRLFRASPDDWFISPLTPELPAQATPSSTPACNLHRQQLHQVGA